jgi:hypothetical protein
MCTAYDQPLSIAANGSRTVGDSSRYIHIRNDELATAIEAFDEL